MKIINNSSNNYLYNNSLRGMNDHAMLVSGLTSVNNTFENNDIDNSKMAVHLGIAASHYLGAMTIKITHRMAVNI